MSVLVTGSSGFLGRKIMDALQAKGFRAIGVDVVPSPYTQLVVDISDPLTSSKHLSRFEGWHLIHAAYPLPGKMTEKNLHFFSETTSDNLLQIPWDKKWFVSSTAVYPLEIKDFNRAEPWEAYGRQKLATEARFLNDSMPGEALVLRLGTLLSRDSRSIFSNILRRALHGKISPIPGAGSLIHPVSDANGVANWIAQSIQHKFENKHEVLTAQNPTSIRTYSAEYVEDFSLRLIALPRARLSCLDRQPVFGVSSWHFTALHYHMAAQPTVSVNAHLLGDYTTLFHHLRIT